MGMWNADILCNKITLSFHLQITPSNILLHIQYFNMESKFTRGNSNKLKKNGCTNMIYSTLLITRMHYNP